MLEQSVELEQYSYSVIAESFQESRTRVRDWLESSSLHDWSAEKGEVR